MRDGARGLDDASAGRPARIDGLLVDSCLTALLRGSEVLPACGIPRHCLVRFDLLAEGAMQSVVKLVHS